MERLDSRVLSGACDGVAFFVGLVEFLALSQVLFASFGHLFVPFLQVIFRVAPVEFPLVLGPLGAGFVAGVVVCVVFEHAVGFAHRHFVSV